MPKTSKIVGVIALSNDSKVLVQDVSIRPLNRL